MQSEWKITLVVKKDKGVKSVNDQLAQLVKAM
jgi:hypothetical protein